MGSSKQFRNLNNSTLDYFKDSKPKVIRKSQPKEETNVKVDDYQPRHEAKTPVNKDNGERRVPYNSNKPRVQSKPSYQKPFNKNGRPGEKKVFNKNGQNNGKFNKFNKNNGNNGSKFDRNDPKFKKKKPYIQKKAGNKGTGFESSNYNKLNKDRKKGKGKALAKGLNIHRWLNAHDGFSTPRNILKVTIAQALAMVTNIDTRIEALIKYLNETTPKKENMKEYESKLHTLVDLQNRRKGITGVIHKQNALITFDFEFAGVKYTQTIDMLVLSIRELKKMLGLLAKDPKSKTNNKTNPFNATKKQMVALLEVLEKELAEYNRITTIDIPR